jgi:hypothetical protein
VWQLRGIQAAELRSARSQECDHGSQEWLRHIGSTNLWR